MPCRDREVQEVNRRSEVIIVADLPPARLYWALTPQAGLPDDPCLSPSSCRRTAFPTEGP